MQPKTVAKRCRQTEEKDSHSMLRATLDKVVEYYEYWMKAIDLFTTQFYDFTI